MNKKVCIGRWVAVLGAALAAFAAVPAGAQATNPAPPQWMQDSGLYFGNNFNERIEPLITNRYLWLWEYFRGGQETRFDLWDARSAFLFNAMRTAYVSPFGSRVLFDQTGGTGRPQGNYVLLHVEDPTAAGGFVDVPFPGTNNLRTVFYGTPTNQSGVVDIFPNGSGTFAPHNLSGGSGAGAYNLNVDYVLSFARDTLRVEIRITNAGGAAKRVGVKEFMNPFEAVRTVFLPANQEKIRFETDFGRAVGTTLAPKRAQIPDTWEEYDLVNGPTSGGQVDTYKGIIRGSGATPPDRVVFGNGLQMFSTQGTWTYNVDPVQDLRLSDVGMLYYWDVAPIAAGQTRVLATYIGPAVAAHGMSDFYVAAPPTPSNQFGFIGALETPFALSLINGDADLQTYSFRGFVQNEANTAVPGATALLTLPDSLTFADPGEFPQRAFGFLDPIAGFVDEGSGTWQVRASGVEAGISPVDAQFATGFGDTALARRFVSVPQGRLYQLQETYKMLGFPFTYNGVTDPATALQLPSGSFVVLTYNPVINDYEAVSALEPGKGYWVRLLGLPTQFTRLTDAARPVNLEATAPFRVGLRNGWNMVANPSPYAIPARELQFIAAPRFLSFEDAVTRGLIRPSLYEFNRKTRVYDRLSQDAVLNPGRGFWIYSFGEQTLVWPVPVGPDITVS